MYQPHWTYNFNWTGQFLFGYTYYKYCHTFYAFGFCLTIYKANSMDNDGQYID